ncbi:MAG: Uma2 family endonuclease, partial [Bacillota bacterium]
SVYTYKDYLKLDDDNQYELMEGELFMVPSPGIKHQRVTTRLAGLLEGFVYENKLGEVFVAPTDIVFDDRNVLQPDILYIAQERLSIIKDVNIQGPPDLAVEVLSPSTARRDRLEKSRLYLIHGVKEYWLVDPEDRIVEVLTAVDKGWQIKIFGDYEVLTSSILTELQIDLKRVFENI